MKKTLPDALPLGAEAPDFALPDATSGKVVQLAACRGPAGLLLLFLCNRCPLVRLIRRELAMLCREYGARGIGAVAINANSGTRPEESRAATSAVAADWELPFCYLYDAGRHTARAYGAVCTPDIFLFDASGRLFYHGAFDEARPNRRIPVSGRFLREALEALLAGSPPPPDQKPSVGCPIKWQAENGTSGS